MENIEYFEDKLEWIYKKDSNGGIRQWRSEIKSKTVDGVLTNAYYRSVSGLVDGQHVTSEWKEVFGKNLGKKNATNAFTQAEAEVTFKYSDRLSKGYHKKLEDAGKGTFHFKPMLAEKYDKKPIDFTQRVLAQPKLDGIRCIARADGLWTRQGKPIVSCPHVMENLRSIFEVWPDLIVDGELYNHELKDDFNKITSLVRKTKPNNEDIIECAAMVQYHFYDALLGDEPDEVFSVRLTRFVYELNLINPEWALGGSLQFTPTQPVSTQEDLDNFYGRWLEMGYEGQMVRYDSAYENKRSKSLMKRKEFIDEEFDVIDVEEGEGNWAGAVKRFIVKLPDGQECKAGVRGTFKDLARLLQSDKPDWAKVRYQEYTPDGLLRFPVVVDYGYGKRED